MNSASVYSYKDIHNNTRKLVKEFISEVLPSFKERKNDEPLGYYSKPIFVHIAPFIDFTVRVIMEDQEGYDESELEYNNLAFQENDTVYAPQIRLGIEMPHRMILDTTDYDILSIGENIHTLIDYSFYFYGNSVMAPDTVDSLTDSICGDLTYLKNICSNFPKKVIEHHPELQPNPFNVPTGEYFKQNIFGTKAFNNAEDLKKDLQSFICQYAGSALAIDNLQNSMLNPEADGIDIKFKYKEQLCEFSIRANYDSDEPLECDLYFCDERGSKLDEYDEDDVNIYSDIEHHVGYADLNDLANTLSSNFIIDLDKELNRLNEYKQSHQVENEKTTSNLIRM